MGKRVCIQLPLHINKSGEEILSSKNDLKRNWVCKCNNTKKPTGRSGADPNDCINHCFDIPRMILDKSASGILGASLDNENRFSPLLPSSPTKSLLSPSLEGEGVHGTEVQGMDVHLFDSRVMSPTSALLHSTVSVMTTKPPKPPPLLMPLQNPALKPLQPQSTIKKSTTKTMLKYPWPMKEQLCRVLPPDKPVSLPALQNDPVLIHHQQQTR